MAIIMSRTKEHTPVSAPTRLQSGGNAVISPMITELTIGFGWNVTRSNSPDTELVPSAIICDENGRALSDDSMVFFNQLANTDGAVRYATKGDSEQIEVNLALVPPAADKIVFVVYVDPDVRRPGTFASVRDSYIRVADQRDDDLIRFDLATPDPAVTAMIFGELYRNKGAWKFRALGDGFTTGVAGVAKSFGLEV
jgi:tellurium resistance protein TerD